MGFAAIGGGLCAMELPGRDDAGVLSEEDSAVDAFRFQGAADPFPAAIPGNTATGFAEASARWDLRAPLPPTLGAAGAAGAAGIGRLPAGGGGGGGGAAALGLGGTSSR